ncbi:hypothetical protein EMPS_00365 [Entomortierella parvispora]|uniref:NET domain-containing protein n=1 Tax=Entomortierella parvispora TaxID=205924 RepID=A0A9P3LRM7_9FUNG|nr:hypothetical protein EMPS_00365 [Entomortierella parvispora]
MGGITLADNPPIDLEGSLALPNGLCHPSLLKELNLLGSAGNLFAPTTNSTIPNFNASDITTATNNQTFTATHTNTAANPTFSISDFLVPGLQTKVWEDWQGSDDLQDFTSNAFDTQDFASDLNAMPFQFGLDNMLGNTPIWDNNAIPPDQAYDEFVFDLAPTAFDAPTTVNIADLIAGPNSMTANNSISPMDLVAASTYQDLALANLYGFNDHSFESDSGSDLDDAEDSDSDDDEEDEDVEEEQSIEVAIHEGVAKQSAEPASASVAPVAPATIKRDDPNKRRMEEALVARINNDLGEEHMAGLFRILNGTSEDDGEDEMEVDLSCLDETTLVQVYQYVESCCMQTMGSILAAEERERAAIAAANAAAAAAEMEAQERQRQICSMERTPELSTSYSSASSISPSPPHPSSIPAASKSKRSNNKRRRSPSSVNYHEGEEYAQEALWPNSATTSGAETTVEHSSKGKRKRANNSGMHGIGGGGTGKGRRIQKDQQAVMSSTILAGQAVVMEDEMEYGEDTEIDIVGI